MSVRENENKNCSSRGLGLAAAAIGVGVGAALYYFFSKRPENPTDEGSTSGYMCEDPHVLLNNNQNSSSSFTTISEHSTSDTSIAESFASIDLEQSNSADEMSGHNISLILSSSSNNENIDMDNYEDDYGHRTSIDLCSPSIDLEQSNSADEMSGHNISLISSSSSNNENIDMDVLLGFQYIPDLASSSGLASEFEYDSFEEAASDYSVTRVSQNESSDSQNETNPEWSIPSGSASDLDSEWEVSSLDTPAHQQRTRSPLQMLADVFNIRSNLGLTSNAEQAAKDRERAFRNRSWALEECSICFDGMLKDQEVLALACSHRFHQACIMPWLQEQQTCPNCRKAS